MDSLINKGINNGCSRISSFSFSSHIRAYVISLSARTFFFSGVLDYVGSKVGTTGNDGIFLNFQLSSNQH
jgi:hypothetical protein